MRDKTTAKAGVKPTVKPIESRSNPIFRELHSLLESSGLKKTGKFLLSGRKTVPEFLATKTLTAQLESVVTFDGAPTVSPGRLQTLLLKKELFDELDTLGTHYPLLVGAAGDIADVTLEQKPMGLELVLALSDPLNMGAALRAAEAFGVAQVVLLAECAHPFLPKVLRASSGSALRVPLAFGPSIKSLSAAALSTLTVLDKSEDATPLHAFRPPKNLRLLIGQEGQGVPAEIAVAIAPKQKISIEMKDTMDSLNAVSAASIALYALRQAMSAQALNKGST